MLLPNSAFPICTLCCFQVMHIMPLHVHVCCFHIMLFLYVHYVAPNLCYSRMYIILLPNNTISICTLCCFQVMHVMLFLYAYTRVHICLLLTKRVLLPCPDNVIIKHLLCCLKGLLCGTEEHNMMLVSPLNFGC